MYPVRTEGPLGVSSSEPASNASQRQALGLFLRKYRERLKPSSLSYGTRRRTPGLRREEVAQLCGISVTWYTWIEQGREVSVSNAVLQRICSVLQLTRAERAYLFELAQRRDPEESQRAITRLPDLNGCVNAIATPAYIMDRAWNLLAWNASAQILFKGWLDQAADQKSKQGTQPIAEAGIGNAPNLLRFMFFDPLARQLVHDWETRARRMVAEFRADCGNHLDDELVRSLVRSLTETSTVFTRWWQQQDVVEREGGVRDFHHELLGVLQFEQVNFRLAQQPDLKLVMLMGHMPSYPVTVVG